MLKEIKTPLGDKKEILQAIQKGYSITIILHLLGINLKSKYDSIKETYTFIMLPSEYKKLVNFNKSYNIFELFNKLVGFKKIAVMAKIKQNVWVGTEDEYEKLERIEKEDFTTKYFVTSEPNKEEPNKEEKPKSFWRRLWKK